MSKHSLIKQLREIFPNTNDFYIPWSDLLEKNGLNKIINSPAINIKENKTQYKVSIAAPGLEKENFNISIDHNVMMVSVSMAKEQEEKHEKFTRQEYCYRDFSRSFNLPLHINEDGITAGYENGILTICLPKQKQEKVMPERKITIQ